MRDVKVDFFEVELPYFGAFDDVDEYDLYDNARLQYEATGKGYQYSEYMSYKKGDKIDGSFEVEDTDPKKHICTVYWSEIDVDFDGRTEEEKDYDAFNYYINMLTDQERDK